MSNRKQAKYYKLLMMILLEFGDTPFTEDMFEARTGKALIGLGLYGGNFIEVGGKGYYLTQKGKDFVRDYDEQTD